MDSEANFKQVNEEALKKHNEFRAIHGSPAIEIDWELAKAAQEYADKIASENTFGHSNSNGEYGENLANSYNSREGYVFSGEDATKNWYDEIKDYKFGEETQDVSKIGHFSQVVWKSSTTAGFGRAKTEKGSWMIVGRYKPAGNFIGNFLENVGAPATNGVTDTTKPDDSKKEETNQEDTKEEGQKKEEIPEGNANNTKSKCRYNIFSCCTSSATTAE